MLATAESELPSLPQVVLRMLDACDENADYQDLGEIIGNDTALTARVLALANSSYFRRGQPVKSLQQALLRLGMENLRTLVITASLRQFLFTLGGDQWQQLRDFWRHSLATALLARALAHLTRYGNPEEAFLVGMLHNVGELVVLKQAGQASTTGTGNEQAPSDAAAEGAIMASSWGLSPLAIDAIRYQQLSADKLCDTPHLVKLISLSTRLAMADKQGLDAAQTLFGLTAALTREISKRIEAEVDSLAEGLGIAASADGGANAARQALLQRLALHGMVDQAARHLPHAQTQTALCEATANASQLLCDGAAIVFTLEQDWLVAGAVSGWPDLDLRLPREPARSLVSRCAATGIAQNIGRQQGRQVELVVDQQLLDLLGCHTAHALPIQQDGQIHGVLVAGFADEAGTDRCKLLELLAARVAGAFAQLAQPDGGLGGDLERQSEGIDSLLRFRQLVHEVSNPVTVIRNYIATLQSQLGEENAALADLEVVREELDRIAELLVQSRDIQEPEPDREATDLVREVQALMELLEGAFFRAHSIDCDVQVPSRAVDIQLTRGSLRQIVLNLARNAVEAMPDGGALTVSVRPDVWQNGKLWAELTLEDDGPGLPEPVRAALFRPVASGKGQGHSGLGLSIVKRLVDDAGGTISCYTDSTGTGFRILLPAFDPDHNQPDYNQPDHSQKKNTGH